jgi:hypothetical protein
LASKKLVNCFDPKGFAEKWVQQPSLVFDEGSIGQSAAPIQPREASFGKPPARQGGSALALPGATRHVNAA